MTIYTITNFASLVPVLPEWLLQVIVASFTLLLLSAKRENFAVAKSQIMEDNLNYNKVFKGPRQKRRPALDGRG